MISDAAVSFALLETDLDGGRGIGNSSVILMECDKKDNEDPAPPKSERIFEARNLMFHQY